jgi:hypothetical protein
MKRSDFLRTVTVLLAVTTVAIAQSAGESSRIWRDPGDIAGKDLYWGPGSEARAPRPPFLFLEEDKSGTKSKVQVRDQQGAQWNVKFRTTDPKGDEIQAEVAAGRIAWALGYFAEETYYVPEGHIDNVPRLARDSPSLRSNGDFHGARFERRSPEIGRSDVTWSFAANPFVGTRELSGLKILMALVGNWDNHDSNNKVFHVPSRDGVPETWYAIADWGSTFGKMDKPGLFSDRSRWNLKDYAKQNVISGVKDGELVLGYRGNAPASERVPLDHAAWFAGLASQLTPKQIVRAFEAAGATPEEASGFSTHVKKKIDELQAAIQRP